MDWREIITEDVRKTKECSSLGPSMTSETKERFLSVLATNIIGRKEQIIAANRLDIKEAQAMSLSAAFIDRLSLDEKRIAKMSDAVKNVIELPDPVGKRIWSNRRPNGLLIERVRMPIGVIGIIYESRPDVTIEASILCLKSGNAVLLKGGKESKHSNQILGGIIKESLKEASLPEDLVNIISAGGREAVRHLLSMSNSIDLIIPRGGESLIKEVVEHSFIPVIKHYKGVCHIYVDKDADIDMAYEISCNAKVQRPGTCNAVESLLVHKDIAEVFLPKMVGIFKDNKVEVRGCERTKMLVRDIVAAREHDWDEEYLDLIISVKIVDSMQEAIEHIKRYGSLHSEAIITGDCKTAETFLLNVDAAAVYHNASTRFTDGGEFGLGAEIGISTDKIHARGPMGLEELTTYKYIIHGNGQVRE